MSNVRKIVVDGRVDPVTNVYQMTVVGLDDKALLKEFAIRLSSVVGQVLAEVIGKPAEREYAGGFATREPTTGSDVPVEEVSQEQVEAAMREAFEQLADACPCPNCVARRAREEKLRANTPDPNIRH